MSAALKVWFTAGELAAADLPEFSTQADDIALWLELERDTARGSLFVRERHGFATGELECHYRLLPSPARAALWERFVVRQAREAASGRPVALHPVPALPRMPILASPFWRASYLFKVLHPANAR